MLAPFARRVKKKSGVGLKIKEDVSESHQRSLKRACDIVANKGGEKIGAGQCSLAPRLKETVEGAGWVG